MVPIEEQLSMAKSRSGDADDQCWYLPMEATGSLPMTLKINAEVTD